MPDRGWYADPASPDQQRWWDGSGWTHDVRPIPVEPPAGHGSARRGVPWLLGLLLLVVGVAAGLGVALLTSDAPVAVDVATDTSTEDVEPVDDEQVEDGQPDDPGEAGIDTPSGTPSPPRETVRATEDDADSTEGSSMVEQEGRTSEVDLVAALESYVDALGAGELSLAHSHLSSSLQQQDGWTHADFTSFWRGRITGAQVLSIENVVTATSSGIVEATIDYHLSDGGLSRELVRARFVAMSGGGLRLDDYDVVETERL